MDALKEDSLSRELPLEELLKGISYRALAGRNDTGATVRMVTSDSRGLCRGRFLWLSGDIVPMATALSGVP